jgi:hypothetical protein
VPDSKIEKGNWGGRQPNNKNKKKESNGKEKTEGGKEDRKEEDDKEESKEEPPQIVSIVLHKTPTDHPGRFILQAATAALAFSKS